MDAVSVVEPPLNAAEVEINSEDSDERESQDACPNGGSIHQFISPDMAPDHISSWRRIPWQERLMRPYLRNPTAPVLIDDS